MTESVTSAAGSEQDLPSLLARYADVITHYSEYALKAERFAELPTVIDSLNRKLNRSKDAFYAELELRSSTYTRDPIDGKWTSSHVYYVQGGVRPFIGDELVP